MSVSMDSCVRMCVRAFVCTCAAVLFWHPVMTKQQGDSQDVEQGHTF
jgi:hypothetical protein